MALRERTRYNITVLLAQLLGGKSMEKMIVNETCDDSDPSNIKCLNYDDIQFPAGLISEEDRWNYIVGHADKDGLVLQLLKVAEKYAGGNDSLKKHIEELEKGFDNRIKKIASAIKNKGCVLFLGPRLLQYRNGTTLEPLHHIFSNEIITKLKRGKVYYDKNQASSVSYLADRYEAIKGATNRDMGNLALNAYNNNKSKLYENVYDKIAQLDFPLIISTNPDDILEANNPGKYHSDYYDRSNQAKINTEIDESKNVIYKIFGSFQNPFSILFTDNDRVQFSKNVVKNDPPLPPLIKIMLENKYYLFLGFDFQDWHLKILIDCLGLAKADKEEKTFALLMDNVGDSSIEHFEKNYKFYFINKEIESFLDDVVSAIPSIT